MLTRRTMMQAGTIGAVLAAGTAACGGSGPKEAGAGKDRKFATGASGQLATMGFNPSDEVGKARADHAEQELPDLRISMDTANFDAQKFTAKAAAGSEPDLIQLDRSLVATFAAKGLIRPLDQGFSVHKVTPSDQYYKAPLQDVTYDGSLYAVPQFFQPSAIIVDQRSADAAGVPPEDFDTSDPDAFLRTVKKASTVKGGKPTTLGFDGDIPGSAQMWMIVFGGGAIGEDGEPTLDRSENIEALTWITRLLDLQGGYAEVTSFKNTMDVFGDKNQYVTDQVVGQSWGQWYVNVLAGTADAVKIRAVPVRDVNGTSIAVAGGSALAVPTGAKNPDGALAWALAVTSTNAWFAAGKARQKTVESDESLNTGVFTACPEADEQIRKTFVKPTGDRDFDQVIGTYYDVLPQNRSMGSSSVGQQITQELADAVTAAVTGKAKPKQALAGAQEAVMRDYRKLAKD